ncbi:transcriptional regulator GcvA [Pokkaliibacter sp. MBI-7]|uniref:transcriptional regulator GcvA n=1 Tax=Pokkaliibacter sp. MBI-7 TaxID=3040600 RepID=UPI002448855E|nr:transcriptional regulator GcvA [Pokkaliibacter sp. MBI-7]MDH2435304.1 transcriptional regulator GcvA [Pokkaliibacter sp. MBI-7]
MSRRLPPLNALKAFEASGTTGSFTRAAELLHVTQSAVSRQVKQLEDILGVELLERRHHFLELTPAGRALLPVLRQSFDKIELSVRSILENTHLTRLKINVPPTFATRWLIPRLGTLKELHPELDLTITTALQDNLVESTELDCAIRFGTGDWDTIDNIQLMQESHIAVCAPALLAREGGARTLDFNRYTLLHVLKGSGRFHTWEHWLRAAQIEDVHTEGGIEFDLLEMAIKAAIHGVGITIADRNMITRELASGQLVQVNDVVVPGNRGYWFVTRPDQADLPHLLVFRHWLEQEIEMAAQTIGSV